MRSAADAEFAQHFVLEDPRPDDFAELDGEQDDAVVFFQTEVSEPGEGARQLDAFSLPVIFDPQCNGLEESVHFPIAVDTSIAGRYQIVDYLGSGVFSRAVQCSELATGRQVCVKIIRNNKDFLDQSLGEIKLLRLLNEHDPRDEKHVLRMLEFFYYREHLFIVCELLRDNLYELYKYVAKSGWAPYFTHARTRSIGKQVLVALGYIHSLGLIHCDVKPEVTRGHTAAAPPHRRRAAAAPARAARARAAPECSRALWPGCSRLACRRCHTRHPTVAALPCVALPCRVRMLRGRDPWSCDPWSCDPWSCDPWSCDPWSGPQNILIKSLSRCVVKLIDFGSSSFVHDPHSSYVQSRSYRAPEVVLGMPYGQVRTMHHHTTPTLPRDYSPLPPRHRHHATATTPPPDATRSSTRCVCSRPLRRASAHTPSCSCSHSPVHKPASPQNRRLTLTLTPTLTLTQRVQRVRGRE
jgi:serine/threonine protein kinase